VVGDVAHVIVQPVLADLNHCHVAQARVHVRKVVGRRIGAVPAPDDHRHCADLALGDPADVVLVEPRRDPVSAAEQAAVEAVEGAQEVDDTVRRAERRLAGC